jgi:peptidoglycan biosynthesis protein MviN/MurJ (putative lipid II flippase)
VKSLRIGLGVAMVVAAACTVAFLAMDGPRAAISPAFSTVLCGVLLYRLVKHPPPPRRWSKQRIIVGAAVLGSATFAVLAALVLGAVVAPDWPTRLLLLAGIPLVLAIVFWAVRFARKEDEAARESMQGAPTD